MIKVKDLTKRYGTTPAIKDVSFKIEKGHVYGLLGANGAGKSTTMNIITGALAPSSGNVTVCGYDLFSQSEKAKACIGYLPEIPPLYTDMKVSEYLKFVAEARRFSGDIAEHVDGVMEKTGVSHVSGKLIKNLSKGYRQRVGIAQALIGDPKIIILDEPTAGLDPVQIIEIRELIASLAPERTVVISSHILSEIEEVCDRVIIISSGKIIACGSPEELREKLLGSNSLVLEAKASATQVAEILRSVGITEKVSITETENGTCAVYAELPDASDPREKLFFAFANAKKALISLDLKRPRLEDLFLLATRDEDVFASDNDEKNARGNEKLPSLGEFLKKSMKSDKKDIKEDEGDDESYRPLFGRK